MVILVVIFLGVGKKSEEKKKIFGEKKKRKKRRKKRRMKRRKKRKRRGLVGGEVRGGEREEIRQGGKRGPQFLREEGGRKGLGLGRVVEEEGRWKMQKEKKSK